MEQFVRIFNSAMELSCLGLYEKAELYSEKGEYKYSPLLKKAIDKFSLLNLTYSLYDDNGEVLLPSDETALIYALNFPLINLIDKLPDKYKSVLLNSDWYSEDSYISVGIDNCYYCMPDLLDKLNDDRTYREANKSINKELELESQKFIALLFSKTEEEYREIRNFLEQRRHAFITNSMFIENEDIRNFKNKYPEIFEAAYKKLSYEVVNLKLCPHCGLVLNEMSDGTLYCVSERCSQKSKGFTYYNESKINGDNIFVLRQNVARYIYYPGILEQAIKDVLINSGISPILWPEKDKWDFEFKINGERWVVDAKDVKRPRAIKEDIRVKQEGELPYDKVIYVVPYDKKLSYLESIRGVIRDKNKILCITFSDFKRLIN